MITVVEVADCTDGVEFYQCCRVCGKLSKSDLFDGAGICADGSQLTVVPSRGGTELVCGSIRELNWRSSPCQIFLERWINERIDEGWQGFPVRFPEQRDQ